jgi:hypothetical protein
MNVQVSVEVFCHVNFNKTFVVLPSLRCSMPTANGSHLSQIYFNYFINCALKYKVTAFSLCNFSCVTTVIYQIKPITPLMQSAY